jgi:hypothetical protein
MALLRRNRRILLFGAGLKHGPSRLIRRAESTGEKCCRLTTCARVACADAALPYLVANRPEHAGLRLETLPELPNMPLSHDIVCHAQPRPCRS